MKNSLTISSLLLFLLCLPLSIQAQTVSDSLERSEEDEVPIAVKETKAVKDSIKYKEPFAYKPNRIHIGIDTYPIISSFVDAEINTASLHLGVSFNERFWLQTDVGYLDNHRVDDDSLYQHQTKGNFIRLGIDYNLSYWSILGDAFLVGIHYGRTNFDQTLQYTSPNEFWGEDMQTITDQNVKSSWLEPRATLQVSAFKQRLSLEAVLGLRVRLGLKGNSVMPTEIPGLGLTPTRGRLVMGYRLCYILDFKK